MKTLHWSKWNPAMIDTHHIPLCTPRYHLSRLTQRIGSYPSLSNSVFSVRTCVLVYQLEWYTNLKKNRMQESQDLYQIGKGPVVARWNNKRLLLTIRWMPWVDATQWSYLLFHILGLKRQDWMKLLLHPISWWNWLWIFLRPYRETTSKKLLSSKLYG